MKNLRLLKISNVQLPHSLNYLSNELRFLNWDGYPLESMPTSFQPYKLVELIMPHSRIKQLWDGIGVRVSLMQKLFFFLVIKKYVQNGLIFSIWLLFHNRVQSG